MQVDNLELLGRKGPPEDGQSVVEVKRHQDFWFDDGSIVLRAEDIQFRVHRGVLARKSTVFNDLFAVARPDGAEVVDGCSVVHLTDSAEDLAHVLSGLYDGIQYRQNGGSSSSWRTIRAFLRLGDKYAIDELHREAMHHLQVYASGYLNEWDNFLDADSVNRVGARKWDEWDAIDLVNTLKGLELPLIRTLALYRCCQFQTETLILGASDKNKIRVQLCQKDIVTCIIARESLQVRHLEIIDTLAASPSRCATEHTCAAGRLKAEASWRFTEGHLNYDPLAQTDKRLREKYESHRVCGSCIKHCISTYHAGRQEIWDTIDEYFEDI